MDGMIANVMAPVVGGIPVVAVVLFLFVVNLLAYASVALDRLQLDADGRRIPGAALLLLALLGGWGGCVIARRQFRNKPRTRSFRAMLGMIGVVQLALIVVMVSPMRPVFLAQADEARAMVVGVFEMAGWGANTGSATPRRFGPGGG